MTWVYAAIAAVALGGALYLWGASDQRRTDAARDAVDYRTTRERIDDAVSGDRDIDDVIDRLRDHAR